jgi:hypothetical protein
MNRTEQRYADHLEMRRLGGEVLWYAFGAISFRLAPKTHYHPDFLVMLADDSLEVHEVKGSVRNRQTGVTKPLVEDDAAVKIKVAAERYPFRFVMAWEERGVGWVFRDYSGEPASAEGVKPRGIET